MSLYATGVDVNGIFLQNAGLIVEQRTYEQDVEAGIIYE